MKNKTFVLLFLLACGTLHSQSNPNILFIGNSYTSTNNLPQMISNIATNMGDRITYSSNTPGGCTFMQHCSNQSMSMIQQGTWDIVVLQEQSQLPSFPQWQVEQECFPYAQRLVDSIRSNNPNAEPMFYMTWGRRNGDQDNASEFPVLGTYEGMDSMLCERYTYMAETNNASLCPVGRVWRYLRTNNPDIELYASDGSHPSVAGTYAAACAFYVMFFHRDPDSITFNTTLDENKARIIRSAVKTVVYDNLGRWQHPTTHVNIANIDEEPTLRVYPNPTTTTLTIEAPLAHTLILQDLVGHTVMTCHPEQPRQQINLDELPAGTYILVARTATGNTSKIIVKRP